MFCTRCGIELKGNDQFCSACGNPTPNARPATGAAAARPLMLDKKNKKIAGVCAGFARYLDTDVTLVRVLWLVAFLGFGVGLLGYIIAWIVMPSDRNY